MAPLWPWRETSGGARGPPRGLPRTGVGGRGGRRGGEAPAPPRAAAPVVALEGDKSGPPVPLQGFTVYDGLLLGMVVVWAANPAFIKWALQDLDPLVFNALR